MVYEITTGVEVSNSIRVVPRWVRTFAARVLRPSSIWTSCSATGDVTVTWWSLPPRVRRARCSISPVPIGSCPSVVNTFARSSGTSCGPKNSRYCSTTAEGANRSS